MSLRVDRTSFLTLTFGMAGLACNGAPPPVVAANVIDIPVQPAPPTDGGLLVARPSETSSQAVAVPQVEDDVGDPFSEGMLSHETHDPGGCGFVDPKRVARPTAECKDDEGTAGSCSVMKGCPGFAFPRQHCESYRRSYKPKVAQRALDCLAKLTGKQVCDDACNTYRCGDRALKMACPDPSADAPCRQIVAKCPSVPMNECRTYLSGLNGAGRAQMTRCLTSTSGCGFGLFSCSESL